MYHRPADLHDALARLRTERPAVVAGGTDFYPARATRPVTGAVLDIAGLAELRGIEDRGDHLRLGAATTWTEMLDTPLPAWCDGLKAAAREVGGVQIQNTGTLAGNLCNASPAADGIPPLLTLDAGLELRSLDAVTRMPLEEFLVGPRRTRLAADQLVTAVLLPKPRGRSLAGFSKLGARRYLVISIVMAAARLDMDDAGHITAARVAVGACSPVARRLPSLEGALVGRTRARDLGAVVEPDHFAPLAPIDDVRADADYRRDAARTVVARLLDSLGAAA